MNFYLIQVVDATNRVSIVAMLLPKQSGGSVVKSRAVRQPRTAHLAGIVRVFEAPS